MKTVNEILATMDENGMRTEAGTKLYVHELIELIATHEDVYDLICCAFDLGYYRGVKAEKNKRRKRKK